MLPALVEVAIAARDLEVAAGAVEDLYAVARDYKSPALEAMALSASGTLALARGETAGAVEPLREALRLWTDLELPYETARTRLPLAEALRRLGDEDGCRLELESARVVFERLGAGLDAARVGELLARGDTGADAGRQALRTFMFTDIVRSTELVAAIGDEAWGSLVRWHDQTLRRLIAAHRGEEVDHAGDGFFVAFDTPADALACAVAIQRALAGHRREHGFAPQVRIGVHTTSALHGEGTYRGKGVHEAARIGALAGGGEILISAQTKDAAAGSVATASPRLVTLKGISEPVQVYALAWE
jgi:class 3 adenylate cyclase